MDPFHVPPASAGGVGVGVRGVPPEDQTMWSSLAQQQQTMQQAQLQHLQKQQQQQSLMQQPPLIQAANGMQGRPTAQQTLQRLQSMSIGKGFPPSIVQAAANLVRNQVSNMSSAPPPNVIATLFSRQIQAIQSQQPGQQMLPQQNAPQPQQFPPRPQPSQIAPTQQLGGQPPNGVPGGIGRNPAFDALKRPLTRAELAEKTVQMQSEIATIEAQLNHFQTNRAEDPDGSQSRTLANELSMKRFMLSRLQAFAQPPLNGQPQSHPMQPVPPTATAGPSSQPLVPGWNSSPRPPPQRPPSTAPPGGAIPLLPQQQFEEKLNGVLTSQGVPRDARMLTIDNREISLYELHKEVMANGGSASVSARDMWSVIGARLGFVSFPGDIPRSSQQIATHIQTVHNMFLQRFETLYIHSLQEQRRKMNAARQVQLGGTLPPNPAGDLGIQMPNSQLLGYANMPTPELRARGLAPQDIEAIERNRVHLQAQAQVMRMREAAAAASQNQNIQQSPPLPGQTMPQQHFPMSSSPPPPQPLLQTRAPSAAPMQPPHSPQPPPQQVPPSQSLSDLSNFPGQSSGPHNALAQAHAHAQAQARAANALRPPQNMSNAMALVQKARQELITHHDPARMTPVELAEEERAWYPSQFEKAASLSREVEVSIALYATLLKEPAHIKRVVQMILVINHQRSLLNRPNMPPVYVVPPAMVMNIVQSLQRLVNSFQNVVARNNSVPGNNSLSGAQNFVGALMNANGAPIGGGNAALPPNMGVPPPGLFPGLGSSTMPEPVQAHISPPSSAPQPVMARKPSPAPAMAAPAQTKPVTTPTPSASTPTTLPPPTPSASFANTPPSAPTPPAASPKSPKNKANRKGQKRKASRAQEAPPQSPKRPRPDEPAKQQPAHTPPQQAPSTFAAPAASSSQLASEWEPVTDVKPLQPPHLLPVPKSGSDEDTAAFVESILAESKPTDGTSGMPQDLVAQMNLILSELGGISGLDALIDAPLPPAPDNASVKLDINAELDFGIFFDFAGASAPDDEGSKVHTPDLIHTNSTAPLDLSPESVGETDREGAGDSQKISNVPDMTRIREPESALFGTNVWTELDGGVAAYHEHPGWKWDGTMPTSDNPWAITQA